MRLIVLTPTHLPHGEPELGSHEFVRLKVGGALYRSALTWATQCTKLTNELLPCS